MLRNDSPKVPPAADGGIVELAAVQVWPRLVVRKTRLAAPPDAIQARLCPAVTRHVPEAAKPNSPGAFGIPARGRTFQVRPLSVVRMTRNLPCTGSLTARPLRPPGHIAMQS